MGRRPGVTLIEVLITIFIMAIGMLALLTLFPLGAVSMGQALKDDRATTCAQIANGIANSDNGTDSTGLPWRNLRNDPVVVQAMTNPGAANPALQQNFPALQTGYAGPSYPVFVDPYYVNNGAGTIPPTIGASPMGMNPATNGIPRIASSGQLGSNPTRFCTLLDDITFGINGLPDLTNGPVERGGIYTWAYMVQRPQWNVSSYTNLWVVVYRGRPVTAPTPENCYSATGGIGTAGVLLTWNPAQQPAPALRRGAWLLDDSLPAGSNVPNMNFYRVVNVTDNGNNSLTLEVQPPLLANVTNMVVLDNAVEVFTKGVAN